MTCKKIGLFFGAGAEMAYGLPSGGEFALDIFRQDISEPKRKFKERLRSIDSRSPYASRWLPDNYLTRPISTFGKNQYEQLVISSLEYKRQAIIDFLNDFDTSAEKIKDDFFQAGVQIDDHFQSVMGQAIGEVVFSHDIKLNEALGSIKLFESIYFSGLLQILEKKARDSQYADLKKIVKSFIELLIGAVGEDFLHKISDSIFEKRPDGIDIFDDFCGFFKFDYNKITGLDLILEEPMEEVSSSASDAKIITLFAKKLLEKIFTIALDYQSLIDSSYRYLFSPKTDWAKFCKISIFLMCVQDYLVTKADEQRSKIMEQEGFYQDIKKLSSDTTIEAIGTTNYNNFIESVDSSLSVIYLNGSVNDEYDPYKNAIIPRCDENTTALTTHITVPFLFTQSGIKPLTSITMSERYVHLYNKFSDCDIIAVIGFGFNADDGHINGLFRELIEKGKKVLIFSYKNNNSDEYKEKLRLDSPCNMQVISIDDNRKVDNNLWTQFLLESL